MAAIEDRYATALRMALPDRAIDGEKIPWVPQGASGRVWFKPLRFDLTTGTWINLIRMAGAGQINRHRHCGGPVIGYVIEGRWHYEEKDWRAGPGTLVWEPPGDVHTLVVDGDVGMTTLFIIQGTIQYLDDANRTVYQDDVFSKMQYYLDYCKVHGLEPVDLRY